MAGSGGGAERATGGLTSAFTRLIGPLTAAVSLIGGLTKLVSVQREFDVLNAGLITATGSADNAAIAFEALRDFAAQTPYDLNQAVEGFTKLVNLGLDPSERALRSYGNTASAMGKDLSQMIEAVADAATGEFERLKEFGIRAKKEGDQVSLTFRGVTTTIGNSAAEIEAYLTGLGEVEFAGAMEQRMDSLDGAISNLGDTWDQLFLTVSQSGIGDAIEAAVRMATDALQGLTDMIASGEMGALLESQAVQWSAWGGDIERSVEMVSDFLSSTFDDWGEEGDGVVQFLIDAFSQLPSNLRAMVQILVTEFAAGFDRMLAGAEYWRDATKAIFTDDTILAAADRFRQRLEDIQDVRVGLIDAALQERDASVKASEDQIAAAARLKEEYEAGAEARAKAAEEDRLARFRIGKDRPGAASSSSGADAAAKAREREFQSLRESLQSEEEAIAASYQKRKAIIEANTAAGSDLRADLMARLDANHREQLDAFAEQQGAELEQLRQSLRTQEESIQESYDKRLEIIRANTAEDSALREQLEGRLEAARDTALADLERQRQAERDSLYNSLMTEEEMLRQAYERKHQLIMESEEITELERQDLLRRLRKQFDDETAAAEQARITSQLQAGEALFGGLADLAKTYKGEQSKTYKALFAISKAFSITQAAMSIATGLAKAQELGFPANLAAMAQVAAAGASILSTIQGSNYSGAYDDGGQIPSGKIGIVGEYGPELVKGPASVTGRLATARAMQEAGGGGGPAAAAPTNLRIINAFDTGVIGDYLGSDEGEELIMNAVRRNQTTIRSIAAGGG
jgi:hypothetical protein